MDNRKILDFSGSDEVKYTNSVFRGNVLLVVTLLEEEIQEFISYFLYSKTQTVSTPFRELQMKYIFI